MLGPATAVLAYSIYQQRRVLKSHFLPVLLGCLAGSVTSMVSAYALCQLLGLGNQVALSTLPKSTTAPIALSITGELGGTASITMAAVITTGVLGAILSPTLAKAVPHPQQNYTCGHRHLQPRHRNDESARNGRARRSHERRCHCRMGAFNLFHRHRGTGVFRLSARKRKAPAKPADALQDNSPSLKKGASLHQAKSGDSSRAKIAIE